MPSTGEILFERDGDVATITLNRPRYRNAVRFEMMQLLADVVNDLYRDCPRFVLLKGAPPGFCSGIDIREPRESSPAFVHQRSAVMLDMISKLRLLAAPVIAVIDGVAIGFGCEFLISADIRLASPTSRFAYFEPKVAVPTPAHRLIQLVGLTHAQDLLLTARMIDAHEALKMGLITHVADDVDAAAAATIEQLQMLAPLALSRTKENIWISVAAGAEESIQHHIEGVTALAGSNDRKEALKAFSEKREPRFTGT
jgi:enoyl-CoA hydratase/carnithine racemase